MSRSLPFYARKWNRAAPLLAVLTLGAAPWAEPALAQAPEEFTGRVVNVRQEPRHRTVHRDGDIYLLDVQINPGDTTFAHTHDAAIMYTFISNGSGPQDGRVSSNTDYPTENVTHVVSNAGPNLFRIIALTNYGAPIADVTADRPTGMPSEPTVENEWFRSYRIELAPGATTAEQEHRNPTAVVQVTEGKVHVSRPDGITAELDQAGDWAWRDPGTPFTLTNAGTSPVTVVVNEARR
jgi:quercetin dioxygenase-like cupin family protein